jgi:hypothetical protein
LGPFDIGPINPSLYKENGSRRSDHASHEQGEIGVARRRDGLLVRRGGSVWGVDDHD